MKHKSTSINIHDSHKYSSVTGLWMMQVVLLPTLNCLTIILPFLWWMGYSIYFGHQVSYNDTTATISSSIAPIMLWRGGRGEIGPYSNVRETSLKDRMASYDYFSQTENHPGTEMFYIQNYFRNTHQFWRVQHSVNTCTITQQKLFYDHI